MGVLPGVADFCIVKPGKVVFRDQEKRGNYLKTRKNFLNSIKNLGHEAYVAYGWEDILEKIYKILN